MEKSDKVWVLPSKFDWSDIGTWTALYEYAEVRGSDSNVTDISGRKILKDVANDVFYSSDPEKLTVVSGLKDYMVIDTDNVLLVCPRDDKRFAELMSELALPEFSKYR